MKTHHFIIVISVFIISWPRAASYDCFPSEMGNLSDYFPDSISSETVFSVTGLDKNICGISMKKWPYSKDSYILYAEDTLNYYIHLLKKTNQKIHIIGKYSAILGDYRFKSFDFAPYKIKKNSTAIGIRFFDRGPTKGGAWECIRLSLFEITESELRPIFSTIVASTAEGNDIAYDTDTHFFDESSSIIIIGKPDETGYNNLIKKSNTSKTTFFWRNDSYSPEGGDSDCGDPNVRCFCQE